MPEVGRFLPGSAVAALLRSQTEDVLPAGVGALVLVAYALALALGGARAMVHRDIA